MEARRCHKCGSVMLPSQRMTINFAFSSLEYKCTRCTKKIAVPEKMMTGAMLIAGTMAIASADPMYMTGGLFVMLSPFYRRLRNPVMDEQTLALGLGIIPTGPLLDTPLTSSRAANKATAAEERSQRELDAAQAAIERALAERNASKPLVKRPVAAAERFHGSRPAAEGGFGRRR